MNKFLIKTIAILLICSNVLAYELLEDDLVKLIDKSKVEKPKSNLDYNYSDFKKYNLKLYPLKFITTKDKSLKEGDILYFKVKDKIDYKNTIINKDDIIQARIENISENKSLGVPSSIKLSNFKYNNLNLNGEINITGANRSAWVYPSYCVLSGFFGAGLLFIPIRGGHAKLKSSKSYVVEIN